MITFSLKERSISERRGQLKSENSTKKPKCAWMNKNSSMPQKGAYDNPENTGWTI